MATGAASEEDGRSPVATPPRMFSLRIVNLDYYMAAPLPGMDDCYSHFQGRTVLEVPVVRIFGATTSGQKTCVHLHKAFPYLYVSYDEDLPQQVNQGGSDPLLLFSHDCHLVFERRQWRSQQRLRAIRNLFIKVAPN